MNVVKSYPDNVFCWVDLATPDPAAAKSFYAGLFGWQCLDIPIDENSSYTMLQIDGKNVAGLGEMPPDMKEQGMPAFWASYVKHSDVDAVAARVAAAGGQVMFPPMDVMDAGRMTMFMDPAGAGMGVWQPRNHIGAQLVNVPNTLVWNELQTRDVDGARSFYSAVFDWTYRSGEGGYAMVEQDGRVQAGIMPLDESWGDNVPSNWMVYFNVEDVDGTVAKAQALGGSVLMPPTAAGDMGRFAVLRDPQGGAFTVMTFNGPTDTPPGELE